MPLPTQNHEAQLMHYYTEFSGTTDRCPDFGVRGVLCEKLILDDGLLLGITGGEDIVNGLKLVDIEIRVEGVQLPESLQVGFRVGVDVGTGGGPFRVTNGDGLLRDLAPEREAHCEWMRVKPESCIGVTLFFFLLLLLCNVSNCLRTPACQSWW